MKKKLIVIVVVVAILGVISGMIVLKNLAPKSLFVMNIEALANGEDSYGGTNCWNSVGYKRGTDTRVCHSCSIERNMQPSFPDYVLQCYKPN